MNCEFNERFLQDFFQIRRLMLGWCREVELSYQSAVETANRTISRSLNRSVFATRHSFHALEKNPTMSKESLTMKYFRLFWRVFFVCRANIWFMALRWWRIESVVLCKYQDNAAQIDSRKEIDFESISSACFPSHSPLLFAFFPFM